MSLNHRQLANAIRFLSIDSVQKANSGHPGMPMGMADIAEVLWRDFLNHNPKDPNWINRDRFVLSNGHGSMLLYSLLHLTGYDLSIEDLKTFRQLHSKTPGHPEYGDTPGVETTTGPLGQGIANGVGMALAESVLASTFNRDNFNIIDHMTYVFLGDGCLMEGISHEVCSLAGTLGLGKLVALWDDNGISIDGEVQDWFADNTADRFEAYNWHVVRDVDGHDAKAIQLAIEDAKKETSKPTLICCKTTIGFGSPAKAGKSSSHGAPIGEDEIKLVREKLDWEHEPFHIPDTYYEAWNAIDAGSQKQEAWNALFDQYKEAYPEQANELLRRKAGKLPASLSKGIDDFFQSAMKEKAKVASRKGSQQVLNLLVSQLPEMLGGSADLTGSNLTFASSSKVISHDNKAGNYLYYGVREFGMAAMMNGIALYGGFIPYGGTFLTFVDYMRNAVRLSAMMKQKVIYVLTHDSIGLGEDGPTHQPIAQIANLRMTPNLHTWRPCDLAETLAAWDCSISYDGPSALILSRQGLPHLVDANTSKEDIQRGGYILKESEGELKCILIATGSETAIAMDAGKDMPGVRVVSMPCTEIFDTQSSDYKEKVLPAKVRARIAIEAASSDFWYKYVGLDGKIVGLNSYGVSSPANEAYEYLGITVDEVKQKINAFLAG